jgi:very-short-patch-repair endonuclease
MRLVAEEQWGVISRLQLRELGFSAGAIRMLLARGVLLPIFPGVYCLGHRRLTMVGRLHAARLAAGPGAFVSHRSAAAHRGLCAHPGTVELTVARGHTPEARSWLRVHRTRLPIDREDARMHNGLPTATVPRIIMDLARTVRPGELQRLIRESIRTGQFDLATLEHMLRAHPRRPGAGIARAALERYLPGSEGRKSWLETQFQQHVLDDPRLLAPLYNRQLLGFEIDVLWPEQRIALELDGRPYHTAVEDFDRDRGKDRALTRSGWRPVRVSDLEWEHDRPSVLDDLYALLGT